MKYFCFRKFWIGAEGGLKSEQPFSVAVETLQQLKTTFCPLEKLVVIQSTFEQMTRVSYQMMKNNEL